MRRNGVLLLGGTGFIGTALVKRLMREAVPVRVVGRDNLQHLPQWLAACSTVIHLASATTPGTSSSEPALEHANLDLTRYLLNCLHGQPDTHLIYFSSGGTVYGDPAGLPVQEDAPLMPLSPYGVAKVAQEQMCQTLCNQGNAVTILRPSNAYGPSQTRRDGFGLVCTLLDHARKGTPMEIWGDGGNVRDFVYIDDVVDVTLHLIRTPQDAGIYNLGSGVGHSVNEVKSLVEHVTGLRVQTVHRPARGIDVRAVVLDCTRLRDRLQWHPCQELRKGVERTWFTNQLQTS